MPFLAVADYTQAHTIDDNNIIECFSVASDGDLLLLPVKLKGKSYLFMLDTGAPSTCFDTELQTMLGEPIDNFDEEGITYPLFRAPDASLGKLSLQHKRYDDVQCRDLSQLRKESGLDVRGIIGMDFLRDHAFTFDPDRGQVRFLRSLQSVKGKPLPISWRSDLPGLPFVDVRIPGISSGARFLIDTGGCGTCSGSITRPLFGALAQAGGIRIVGKVFSSDLHGTQTERVGWLRAMVLGNKNQSNLLFTESRVNILGLNYWSRYVSTFDFARGVMYLQESRRFNEPDALERSAAPPSCTSEQRG
jgi:hypothetical protein